MHRLLYLLLIPLIYFIVKTNHENKKADLSVTHVAKTSSAFNTPARLKKQSDNLLAYAKQRRYNCNYAFMIDMGLPSGSNRFFVYDFKNDSVLKSGLVTHGYGLNDSRISFSNVPGSYCTSLGKYKIGNSYHGRFGLAYKLYGLDSSNSNAFNRFVVLHSHACVPDSEASPLSICMSQGCPTVSPSFLKVLKNYLDNAEKPVLLYIFY
jgi:hypothetical protein